MDPQIWIGPTEPTPEQIDPIVNHPVGINKPCGGLWTSTETTERSSGWIEWCRRECWWNTTERLIWRLHPQDDLDVLHVISITDLEPWFQPDVLPTIDWEALFEDYHGVHLTTTGLRNTRFTFDTSTPSLYGWDCETTLWSEWVFDDVEFLGRIEDEEAE